MNTKVNQAKITTVIKTGLAWQHNVQSICESFKLFPLCFGLRLVQVHPNLQEREPLYPLTLQGIIGNLWLGRNFCWLSLALTKRFKSSERARLIWKSPKKEKKTEIEHTFSFTQWQWATVQTHCKTLWIKMLNALKVKEPTLQMQTRNRNDVILSDFLWYKSDATVQYFQFKSSYV